jgi:hypothetical protein
LACDPFEPDELEESVAGFDDPDFDDPDEEPDPESDDFEGDPESEELDDEPASDEPDEELEPECSFSFEDPFLEDRLSVL